MVLVDTRKHQRRTPLVSRTPGEDLAVPDPRQVNTDHLKPMRPSISYPSHLIVFAKQVDDVLPIVQSQIVARGNARWALPVLILEMSSDERHVADNPGQLLSQ